MNRSPIIWWWENYWPISKILKLKVIIQNKSKWKISKSDINLGRLRIRYWFRPKRKPICQQRSNR